MDKPPGLTSTDVVNRVRRGFGCQLIDGTRLLTEHSRFDEIVFPIGVASGVPAFPKTLQAILRHPTMLPLSGQRP